MRYTADSLMAQLRRDGIVVKPSTFCVHDETTFSVDCPLPPMVGRAVRVIEVCDGQGCFVLVVSDEQPDLEAIMVPTSWLTPLRGNVTDNS